MASFRLSHVKSSNTLQPSLMTSHASPPCMPVLPKLTLEVILALSTRQWLDQMLPSGNLLVKTNVAPSTTWVFMRSSLVPATTKIVSSRWVFCIKYGPNSSIQKYNAHIVAQGFTQVEGIDFNETFALVVKLILLHVILVIAVEKDLELYQMDVKSVYLNGTLKEEIFMSPPLGFNVLDGMVFQLIKAVYGMKQGRRIWYENIKARLISMRYHNTQADYAIFMCSADPYFSIITLYVDDITMASTSLQEIKCNKVLLCQHYKMTDLGDLT